MALFCLTAHVKETSQPQIPTAALSPFAFGMPGAADGRPAWFRILSYRKDLSFSNGSLASFYGPWGLCWYFISLASRCPSDKMF